MASNVLHIEEVAEGNFGKSLVSLLSAVRRYSGTFLLGNFIYTTTSATKVFMIFSVSKISSLNVSMWNLIADFTSDRASSYISLSNHNPLKSQWICYITIGAFLHDDFKLPHNQSLLNK